MQESVYKTLGTTLAEECVNQEYRRVFLLERDYALEVGEYTCGPQTQEVYDSPSHHHFVQLADHEMLGFVASFFEEGKAYLADLMDALDAARISYGYLNTTPGKFVAFRPRS